MAKEVIITGKYRQHEGAAPQRMSLKYYIDHRKDDSKPELHLYNGEETPLAVYSISRKPDTSLDNPANPDFLRSNLKDLSRKLTDSGVFPPGFFEELDQRLKQNQWQKNHDSQKPKSF